MFGVAADPQLLERSGEWARAAEAYQQQGQQALRERNLQGWLRALNNLGRMLQEDGRPEEAEEAATLSWMVAERCGLAQQTIRAMNILAAIRCREEDLDTATELWQRALEHAREARDAEMVGMICQNLGVVANIRGDLREARTLYLECIATSIRAGNRMAAVTAYNNLGMVCTDLEEWLEAEIYFERGIEITQQLGDAALLVKLYANRAEPLIRVGEFARAEASLAWAEAQAAEMNDQRTLADIHRHRGTMSRFAGVHEEAEAHLERALGVAAAAELELERGEALEEMARLRWAQRRPGAARVLAREALRTFEAVGARQDASRLTRAMEEWSTGR